MAEQDALLEQLVADLQPHLLALGQEAVHQVGVDAVEQVDL